MLRRAGACRRLRSISHFQCCVPRAPQSRTDTYADANPDSHANTNTHSDPNPDPDSYSNSYSYSNSNPHSNSHAYTQPFPCPAGTLHRVVGAAAVHGDAEERYRIGRELDG